MFWEKSMCYSVFEKTFSYLSWLSLLLILESWVLNLDVDSWKLEPWILILDSWFLILEINFPLEPWSVLDSILNILNILNSFFDWPLSFLSSPLLSSKHLWINLDSSWNFSCTSYTPPTIAKLTPKPKYMKIQKSLLQRLLKCPEIQG